MTGTTRASYPAAVEHDRQSRDPSGQKTMKKHGAGPHNWGSAEDEARTELETTAADGDDPIARKEELEETGTAPPVSDSTGVVGTGDVSIGNRSLGTEGAAGAGGRAGGEQEVIRDAPTNATT